MGRKCLGAVCVVSPYK